MHELSKASMQRCVEKHAPTPGDGARLRVLDVGSMDVNGSYRALFDPQTSDYTGVDLEDGNGVDLVLESPYTLPFDDGAFDLIVSGQMLEHNEFFWLTFKEMMRVLRPDGLCYLIAPSRGEIHRYPADCYRFYPDGYRALAKYTRTQIIDCWVDTENPWGDLTGVFRKREVDEADQFDTTQIDSVGGPAKKNTALTIQLRQARKQLEDARAKLAALGASRD